MDSKHEPSTLSKKDPPAPTRVLRSQELFEGARELGILHGDALYRLTMTRQGKLILTK